MDGSESRLIGWFADNPAPAAQIYSESEPDGKETKPSRGNADRSETQASAGSRANGAEEAMNWLLLFTVMVALMASNRPNRPAR